MSPDIAVALQDALLLAAETFDYWRNYAIIGLALIVVGLLGWAWSVWTRPD